jgi:hypothetical protein
MGPEAHHNKLIERAVNAINAIYDDCTVSSERTLKDLEDLADQIMSMMDTLKPHDYYAKRKHSRWNHAT